MPWFDRALKSVQGTAEKAAFEADKMVRVHREESALSEIQNRTNAKLAELGKAALALYRSGALTDPSVGGLAGEIADLEAQVEQQQAKVDSVRNEQYQAGGQPPAPVAAQAPAAPEAPAAERIAPPPVVSDAAPAAAPALVECPNCHTQVKTTAAFCPECGNKMH